MENFSTAIVSWNVDRAKKYAAALKEVCKLDREPVIIWRYDHEPNVLNEALQVGGGETDFVWLLTIDVDILYPELPYLMTEFMLDNDRVGVMCPNREGEPYRLGNLPEPKYLQDNTAIMVRKSTEARFDPEFIFTGWNDLDFGLTVESAGYFIYIENRASVQKQFTPYGSWSAFRRGYNARNRILLEAKWWWVGIKDWQGVDIYNVNVPPSRRIPTVFELAWWSEDRLNAFADTVNMEHPQICMTDGHTGNEGWEFLG